MGCNKFCDVLAPVRFLPISLPGQNDKPEQERKKMSRLASNAGNEAQDPTKDEIEKQGGPLHFPASDDVGATKQTLVNAKAASDKEHSMTLMQGIRLYPKAIGWSILISTTIAMEGYDVALINNLYGFNQFNRQFGVQGDDGTYQIPARWQAGLSNGAQVGEMIGLFINGWVAERIGYRYVCIIATHNRDVVTEHETDIHGMPRMHYWFHCHILYSHDRERSVGC